MDTMDKAYLLDTKQVADELRCSIHTVRKYKGLSIIRPVKTIGSTDLYDRDEIIRTRDIISALKHEGKSLEEVSDFLRELFCEPPNDQKDYSTRRKLLIIDDEIQVIDIIKAFVGAHFPGQFQFFYELHGTSGIRRTFEVRPDIVILDIGLNDILGTEVYDTLMTSSALTRTEIIVISGKIYAGDSKLRTPTRGLEVGTILPKPIDFPKLVSIISQLSGLSPQLKSRANEGTTQIRA